ncbi:MAG: hypothetical protein PHI79_07985 [Sulfurovaceae bacterium]|nr:hypothetical protein [Sulfurovaceae bacterium]
MKKPIKAREYNLPTKIKSDKLFVKSLKLIKEYLPLIILLPAILGGLWQIIALASMSIAYIRFFSATQLIADGLLAILVILPWLVCAYFYNISREEFYVTLEEAKKSFLKKKYYIRKGLMSLLYMLLITAIVYFLLFYVLKINNEFIKYFGIIPFVFLIIFMLDAIFFNIGFVVILDKIFNSKIFKVPFIFLLSMLFLVILPFLFDFRFYIPRNLENLENLDKYSQNKNAKLRYFNDKYIFIEHKKEDNSTTIQVVPFEELFDSK